MEPETYDIIIIAFLAIILLVSLGEKAYDITKNDDVLSFIMEQCLNESSVNASFTTGTISMTKMNNTCLLEYRGRCVS